MTSEPSTEPARVLTPGWRLPPLRRTTLDTPEELASVRGVGSSWEPQAGVVVSEQPVGGVACIHCRPEAPTSVTLYLHGGGYRLGRPAWWVPFAARLARAAATTVVLADYRLAPEHPFPAALHDAAAVYDELAGGDTPVYLAGDSAGGGLSAALALAAAAAGVTAPAGLVLMSPWLDLTCSAASYSTRAATDGMFSLASARQAADLYLQGHDPRDPLASPGLAPASRWPPVLLFASTDEVLVDDAASFVSSVAGAASAVTAVFEPGRAHGWPALRPDDPGSAVALETIASFYAIVARGSTEIGACP